MNQAFIPLLVPMVEFMRPGRLWVLLIALALILLYVVLSVRAHQASPKKRAKTRLNLVIPTDPAWKRHLSVIAALLALCSLIVAWAQPQAVKPVPRERATVVVALDISRSMMAQDITPTRIAAAQDAAKDFLDMLPSTFNVSLVLFAGTVDVKTVPTTDRTAIKTAIDNIELAPATAVGDGIEAGLDMLRYAPPDPDDPTKAPPAAMVLLSDGYTNAGIDPEEAANDAKDQGVPIYTIAYGTAGGYVQENGARVPVPVDHQELSRIAQISGGKKYSAESAGDLHSVYETLAESLGYDEELTEITDRYAGYAFIFAFLAAIGVISLAARWP